MNAIMTTPESATESNRPRFAAYRFYLVCESGGSMPPFAGSALRGAFGMALRHLSLNSIKQGEILL